LTGGPAVSFVSERISSEIAVDQINAAGGILGRPVEMIVKDVRLDPDVATRVAKELILEEKIDAFLLAPVNACQTPQLQLCKEHGIWSIGELGQDIEMMNEYMSPYQFSMGPIAPEQAKAMAIYLESRLDIETYITLGLDYSWGYAVADLSPYLGEESRLKCEGALWVPVDETEFGSYVAAIEAKKPDAVFIGLFGNQFLGVYKELSARGLADDMAILSFCQEEEIIDGGREIPEGVVMMGNEDHWAMDMNSSYYRTYFEEYQKRRPGRVPSHCACMGYDRIMTLMQGIQKANSFDPRDITIALEDATLMNLEGPVFMRGLTHSFLRTTFFGTTQWDESLGYCDVVGVVGISGWRTMLTDEDILRYRQEHNVEFRPLSAGNWWEEVPVVK